MKPIIKIYDALVPENQRIVVDCDSVLGPITATISQIESLIGSIENKECNILISEYKHIQYVHMAVVVERSSAYKCKYIPCSEIRLNTTQKLNALNNAFYYCGRRDESNISPKFFDNLLSEFKPNWKEKCEKRWKIPYTLLLRVYNGKLCYRDNKTDEFHPIEYL
jgi:hypothetical protein